MLRLCKLAQANIVLHNLTCAITLEIMICSYIFKSIQLNEQFHKLHLVFWNLPMLYIVNPSHPHISMHILYTFL